jgi:MSHA biogenesis protein MshP
MKTVCFFAGQKRSRQRGVSIISAIFMLLLFAAIAAFMVSMVSTANITSAQDVQGARAYQAAQAGVEWGLFQMDPNGSTAALPDCFAPSPTVLPAAAIPGFSVSVLCTSYPLASATSYAEAGRTIRIFQFVATATVAGALVPPAAVERQVTVRVEKCRDSTILAPPFDC